jgi:hypothetical protein
VIANGAALARLLRLENTALAGSYRALLSPLTLNTRIALSGGIGIDFRDRATPKGYLYSGARIGTAHS